jgi:hypothetical protein
LRRAEASARDRDGCATDASRRTDTANAECHVSPTFLP